MGRSEELEMILNGDPEILKTVHGITLCRNQNKLPIAILFGYFYERKGHIMLIEYQPEIDKLYEIFTEVFLPITERIIKGKLPLRSRPS